jgi:hypothetical protein
VYLVENFCIPYDRINRAVSGPSRNTFYAKPANAPTGRGLTAIVVRKVGSASDLPMQNDQLMSKYRISQPQAGSST